MTPMIVDHPLLQHKISLLRNRRAVSERDPVPDRVFYLK